MEAQLEIKAVWFGLHLPELGQSFRLGGWTACEQGVLLLRELESFFFGHEMVKFRIWRKGSKKKAGSEP